MGANNSWGTWVKKNAVGRAEARSQVRTVKFRISARATRGIPCPPHPLVLLQPSRRN